MNGMEYISINKLMNNLEIDKSWDRYSKYFYICIFIKNIYLQIYLKIIAVIKSNFLINVFY